MREFTTYFPFGKLGFLICHIEVGGKKVGTGLIKETLKREQIVCSSTKTGFKKLGLSNRGRMVCLLTKEDAAFSKSVVDDFFASPNIYHFYMNFNFNESEPFALISFDDNTLFELKWDGVNHGMKNLPTTETYLWDSKTLSSERINDAHFQRNKEFEAEELAYHLQVKNLTASLISYLQNKYQEEDLLWEITPHITTINICPMKSKMIYENENGIEQEIL